jgi:hypothetical protein
MIRPAGQTPGEPGFYRVRVYTRYMPFVRYVAVFVHEWPVTGVCNRLQDPNDKG